MIITCQNPDCTDKATERLGWYDEDMILWYSFMCWRHSTHETPDTLDNQVPHFTRSFS